MPDQESGRSGWLGALGDAGRQLFSSLPLGLVVFDERLEIVDHNPAAALVVGPHTSIAAALNAGTVEAQYEDWAQVLQSVLRTGHERRFDQVLYRHPSKGERLLQIRCAPLRTDASDRISGGTLMIEDVTEAVGLEKRLAVSERMAAVGKLAARVAHELNNPLDGILRYLNLAIRAFEVDKVEKVPDYLKQGRSGLMRMAEILRELVEFSRSTASAFDEAGLNAIVDEAVKVMCDKAVTQGVSVVCHLSEDMPPVRGANLFQVFCNLIKNAIDAMPGGGRLMITTRMDDRDAIIEFADTGEGLPPGVQIERLFEPFFTTKEPGKGTGLGLAISRDIVEKYDGRIIVEPRDEGGAVFTVRLPLTQSVVTRREPSLSAKPEMARSRFASDPRETPA